MSPRPHAIGIVVPTYNRCDALVECLQRLERQTCKDFEVVIVDDGSTDATAQRISEYLSASSLTIRYVKQRNSGPAKARNAGIALLNSPICLLIGDDIFASATLVENHLEFHRTYPNLNAAALGWTKWSREGQTITPIMRCLGENPAQFDYKSLLSGKKADWRHFYTSNLSVKTELLRRFPFDERFPYAAMEDCELGYRIEKTIGLEVRFVPDAVAFHLHPTTFLQACKRMVRVGQSTRILHEVWPELARPSLTPYKRATTAILKQIARNRPLTDGIVKLADEFTKIACPNPLMRAALRCNYLIGYAQHSYRQNERAAEPII